MTARPSYIDPTDDPRPTEDAKKVEPPAVRAVKTAPKAAVRAAIERIANAHRHLIKDLAK